MELHLPELALPDDLAAKWPSSSFGGRRGRPSIPQPLPVTEIVRDQLWVMHQCRQGLPCAYIVLRFSPVYHASRARQVSPQGTCCARCNHLGAGYVTHLGSTPDVSSCLNTLQFICLSASAMSWPQLCATCVSAYDAGLSGLLVAATRRVPPPAVAEHESGRHHVAGSRQRAG